VIFDVWSRRFSAGPRSGWRVSVNVESFRNTLNTAALCFRRLTIDCRLNSLSLVATTRTSLKAARLSEASNYKNRNELPGKLLVPVVASEDTSDDGHDGDGSNGDPEQTLHTIKFTALEHLTRMLGCSEGNASVNCRVSMLAATIASVLCHSDAVLSRRLRARATSLRMSSTLAVQVNVAGKLL
jgi:hypothetical protein